MILIYEKISNTIKDDETIRKVEIVAKKDATHVHKCRHDEGLPCSREKL